MFQLIRWVLLFFGLMLVSQPLLAGVAHDVNLNWQTKGSEHFLVHYHDAEEALADKTLSIAERVHVKLSKIFAWNPTRKTDIVISDEHDLTNGMATPIPSNRIILFMNQPSAAAGFDHAGWLETLILHEYVHILHLDKAVGPPKGLRKVLGRHFFSFPNSFQPTWLIEGLATYYETDKNRGIGRGQSSVWDMMMRMEINVGLKPVNHVNQPITSWPTGRAAYLYGVHFYQFVSDTYGEKKVQEMVSNFSNNLVPFRINANVAQELGLDLTQLWQQFEVYLHNKFDSQITDVKERGEIKGEALTKTGYYHGSLTALPDGRIFYIRRDGRSKTMMMVRHIGEKAKELVEVRLPGSVDIHSVAGLLVTSADICNNARMNYDIYRINIDSGDKERLTHCQRYISASWMPDGKSMIAVQNGLSQHAMYLLNAQGEQQKLLWQGEYGETLGDIDISPDGDSLVASVWRKKGGWNLETFDVQSKTWTRLTHSSVIERNPRYNEDGTSLLFSADYDGIYNIHRVNLKTGVVYNLTDVVGGAFSPFQTSNDSTLYYIGV